MLDLVTFAVLTCVLFGIVWKLGTVTISLKSMLWNLLFMILGFIAYALRADNSDLYNPMISLSAFFSVLISIRRK